MYKIEFVAQGTNLIEAEKRLKTAGLKPLVLGDYVSTLAKEVDPVRSLVENLGISKWRATKLD